MSTVVESGNGRMDLPGYIDIGGARLHVARIRPHTRNIHRFRAYLPKAQELIEHGPQSEAAASVVQSVDDVDALLVTVKELGAVCEMLAHDCEG